MLATGTGFAMAHSAAGPAARTAMRLRSALGDGARSAADEPLHGAAALRAGVQGGIGHLLAALEVRSASIALVFVGWHLGIPL